MAYFHGIRISESPTPLQAPAQVDSALPVFIGAAPVHRLEDPARAVNNPALIFDFAEGVQDMGYMEAAHWKKFPLSMALFSQTRLHRVAPLVLINVWDPRRGARYVVHLDLPAINGKAAIEDPMAMISAVAVHNAAAGAPDHERGKDYSLRYDGDKLLIEITEGGEASPREPRRFASHTNSYVQVCQIFCNVYKIILAKY